MAAHPELSPAAATALAAVSGTAAAAAAATAAAVGSATADASACFARIACGAPQLPVMTGSRPFDP